jgi:hypothetical protein
MIIVDDEPTICEELSLTELKALQKEHNISLDRHYNKKDLVELLKQHGILPASYTIGRRRVKNQERKTHLTSRASAELNSSLPDPQAGSPHPAGVTNQKHTTKVNIRGRARRVELTLIDGSFQPTESQVFPSLYKAAKFLGTFGSVMTHFDGRWYKSKIDGKMYRVTILDPALA